jgi:hypothetical protein
MAYFAKLDVNSYVEKVIVVGDDIATSNGPLSDNPKHVDGETYCANLYGGTWKQSPENNEFRKQRAAINSFYDSTKDIFISPKPFTSWVLNSNNDWEAPVDYPTVVLTGTGDNEVQYDIYWNEDTASWNATIITAPSNVLVWDSANLSWS